MYVLLIYLLVQLPYTPCTAESIVPGDADQEDALVMRAAGRSITAIVSTIRSDGQDGKEVTHHKNVVTNIRMQGASGLYVGDTRYGPATADVISDSCMVIYGKYRWSSMCNAHVRTTAPPRDYASYASVNESDSLPRTSCAFHCVYTSRFYSALGSEGNVARYIATVFKLADQFYMKSLPGAYSAFGIHYIDIDHSSRFASWSDDADISTQLTLLNAHSVHGTCGVVLFDAADYTQLTAGVALIGGACTNGSNGAVVSCGAQCANTFFAAQILAHEAGHLFGAYHAVAPNCGEDIMNPTITQNLRQFGPCTIPTLESFFDDFAWCLTAWTRPRDSSSTDWPLIIGLIHIGGFSLVVLVGLVLRKRQQNNTVQV